MPKIENEYYKTFKDKWTEFKPLDVQIFLEKVNLINYKSPQKTSQARVLLSLAFWTGLRPAELIELKPINIDRETGGIVVKATAKKGGVSGKIFLPINENTKYIYDYCKSIHPEMFLFPYFYKAKPANNKVHWTIKQRWLEKQPDGTTKEIERLIERKRTYKRYTNNLDKLAFKWFGFPIYYFRHNRFSEMALLGASLEDIRQQKLAKTVASAFPYVKFGVVQAKKRAKFLPRIKKEKMPGVNHPAKN